MVIRKRQSLNCRGFVLGEMMLAMGILVIAFLPLCFSINADAKLFRVTYQRAVAMEIVDGEMEILAAGGWRDIPDGTHPYSIHANAATNLPPGHFQLTRTGNHFRLEWASTKKSGVGIVVREVVVK